MATKSQQVKHFFDQTDLYLKNTYAIRARVEIIQELLGNVHHASILDIGCGDGSLSRPFLGKENRLHLLDISEKMLQVAEQNTPLEFRDQITFTNMDFLTYFPKSVFDVILCVGVLAHVDAVDQTITKISQLLPSKGLCILQFTDQTHLMARIQLAYYNLRRKFTSGDIHHIPGLSSDYMFDLLQQHNLHVIRQIQYSLLLPGMGRLPQSLLYHWLIMTLRNPMLSRFGSEKILLISKV